MLDVTICIIMDALYGTLYNAVYDFPHKLLIMIRSELPSTVIDR